MEQWQQSTAVSRRPPAEGNGQVELRQKGAVAAAAERPSSAATLTDVDDAKTHQLVRILSSYNLRRLHLVRNLSNDELATTLLHHLRQSTEREYLRVLKA